MAKAKFRIVGWCGFSDGKPFFELVRDSYYDGLTYRLEVFTSFHSARRRFKHVEAVYRGLHPRKKGDSDG
jgi:hypothetical protein